MYRIDFLNGHIDRITIADITFPGAQVRACIELIKLRPDATTITHIKLVRDLTQCGLKEAKDLVVASQYAMGINLPSSSTTPSRLSVTISDETWAPAEPKPLPPATTLGELLRRKLEQPTTTDDYPAQA